MNLDILFNAPLAIQLHVYAAILAFFVGVSVLWRRKGNTSHKRLGKIWVVLMVITALTSFFIHEIRLLGPFSPIHLVSLGTIISLYFAVKHARNGHITDHQRSMKGTFIGGMGIAGVLAFLPGRMMYEVTIAPAVEGLLSINGMQIPEAVFTNNWQVPVMVVSIILLVSVWRQLSRLFRN